MGKIVKIKGKIVKLKIKIVKLKGKNVNKISRFFSALNGILRFLQKSKKNRQIEGIVNMSTNFHELLPSIRFPPPSLLMFAVVLKASV